MLVLPRNRKDSFAMGSFFGDDSSPKEPMPKDSSVIAVRLADVTRPIGPSRQTLLKVLIVDDNRDSADSCATLVKIWGHECRHAYDGATALEMSVEFQPDIVLLDIGMPTMDGFDVARQLGPLIRRNGGKLIAITGYADHKHRLQCEQAGFDVFLAKPVDPEVLEKLLLVQSTRRRSNQPEEFGGEATGGR